MSLALLANGTQERKGTHTNYANVFCAKTRCPPRLCEAEISVLTSRTKGMRPVGAQLTLSGRAERAAKPARVCSI